MLVVWKLDRLARSLNKLITTAEDLEEGGIGLVSLAESINTTTPGGVLVFHVFGAIAQFERALIRERTALSVQRHGPETRGRVAVPGHPGRDLHGQRTLQPLEGALLARCRRPGQFPLSCPTASGVQLRRRRASRSSVVSPSKSVAVWASCELSTPSKVVALTTANRLPSIMHVTIGTTPHVEHTWNSAVPVPSRYDVTREASVIRR